MLKDNNLTDYSFFNITKLHKGLDDPYSYYDLQMVFVPPPTDSSEQIQSALSNLQFYNKSSPATSMDNFVSKGLLKGLVRMVKYYNYD